MERKETDSGTNRHDQGSVSKVQPEDDKREHAGNEGRSSSPDRGSQTKSQPEVHPALRESPELLKIPICPICGTKGILVDSTAVYGNRFRKKDVNLWVCPNYPRCDAYVGVHPGTKIPLGTMADGPTRAARKRCHELLDLLWMNNVSQRYLTRDEAYRLVQLILNKPPHLAHIGMLDKMEAFYLAKELEKY